MSGWQVNHARGDADTVQAVCQMMSGALSGLVFILIKNDIDQTIGLFGKLMELKWR